MRFERATLQDCSQATDIVVVIDVLRAFSSAAYAFAAGAASIHLVGTAAEAFALKAQLPGALLMGEEDGLAIAGFDFGNSPDQIRQQNLAGRPMIQRTSAGTQGVVRSKGARKIIASSLCVAAATARWLEGYPQACITFVSTGKSPGGWGEEDDACADHIESLLSGGQPDPEAARRRVRDSRTAQQFTAPSGFVFPAADVDLCTQVDAFHFALPVERQDGQLVMRAVVP